MRKVLALAVLLVACNRPAETPQEITPPAAMGSAEPFLFATRDGVLLSWLEPRAGARFALRFSRYVNGRWSAPRTIVERSDLFVNWADFPSVVEDANGALYAHWLQKSGPGTYAYDVRMATSRDGGSTWSAPFLLNRDGKQAEHGFVSLAPLPGGGVAATWLDGRNMSGSDGDMTIRYARVRADGAIDGDEVVDPRTCECCTTAMTVTNAGPVIAYRDRSQNDVRDISYVSRKDDRWTEPRAVRADGWKINGCPVNGPQLDAIGNRAVMAWFTAAQERQRVYVAFSSDGGATFGNAIVVDDGKPAGRVDVVMLDETAAFRPPKGDGGLKAAAPDTALVTWLEQTPAGAEIRARRVSPNGPTAPSIKIADSATARAAGFTRIARSGDEVWFTWTDHDKTAKRIRVARALF